MVSAEHKRVVQECQDKVTGTHSCRKEANMYRDGWRAIDLECHPLDKSKFKAAAIEAEINSSQLQRDSNYKDLVAWQNLEKPNREIFQISDSSEFDIERLVKQQFRKSSHASILPRQLIKGKEKKRWFWR